MWIKIDGVIFYHQIVYHYLDKPNTSKIYTLFRKPTRIMHKDISLFNFSLTSKFLYFYISFDVFQSTSHNVHEL